MVASAPGQLTMTAKMWVKGQNSRMELTQEGQTMVAIVNMDKQVAYIYFPAQNMATKMSIQGGAPTVMSQSLVALSGFLAAASPSVVGTEKWDGKDCLIIETTDGGQTIKVWVWKKYGCPVRLEVPSPGGTMMMEYKNIDFGNIPDSMFELPAGVQIQQQ